MKVISLYTGAGGLDLGLEAAGFENALAVEMNPVALATLRQNRDRWGVLLDQSVHAYIDTKAPLRKRAQQLLTEADLRPGDVTLLAGGPPCQPFSKSGYWARGDSRRLEDPRAKTLSAYLDVLGTALPEVFLLENVPGLSYSSKNEGLELLRAQVGHINEVRGVNYSFCVAQLNSAEFGVPQLRNRVFVIGHRDGIEFEFPTPTHALPPGIDISTGLPKPSNSTPNTLMPARTVWDAIGLLEVDGESPDLRPRGKWAPVLATIPEGVNYLWHTNRGGGLSALWGWRCRYWSMLLKLAKARPSWTLTATPGPATGPFHWENRRLATAELAALQTFPDDYEIVGSNREAHFQLGNAVPSAMAEILGLEICRQYFGHNTSAAPTLIPASRGPAPAPATPATAETLPAEILALVRDYEDHCGVGLGQPEP